VQFLLEYGYVVLFVLIFLDQVGLPLPSIPVILGAGALAGTGDMNIYLVVLVTVAACLPIFSGTTWDEPGAARCSPSFAASRWNRTTA